MSKETEERREEETREGGGVRDETQKQTNKRDSHLVRPGQETQAAVLEGGVLEGIPEADGAGRVRVEEDAVLVGGHGAADLGLLADDHALQAARVREPEAAGDGGRVHMGGGGGGGIIGGRW